jgi:hypothetical protein
VAVERQFRPSAAVVLREPLTNQRRLQNSLLALRRNVAGCQLQLANALGMQLGPVGQQQRSQVRNGCRKPGHVKICSSRLTSVSLFCSCPCPAAAYAVPAGSSQPRTLLPTPAFACAVDELRRAWITLTPF